MTCCLGAAGAPAPVALVEQRDRAVLRLAELRIASAMGASNSLRKARGLKGVPLRAAGRVRTPLFQRARAHLNVLLRQRARQLVPARHDRLRRGARVADVRSLGRAGAPVSHRQLGGSLCAGGNGAAAGPTMDWTRAPTAPRRWVEIISAPHSGRFAWCLHWRRVIEKTLFGLAWRPRRRA